MSGASLKICRREGWFCILTKHVKGLALPGDTESQRARYL